MFERSNNRNFRGQLQQVVTAMEDHEIAKQPANVQRFAH